MKPTNPKCCRAEFPNLAIGPRESRRREPSGGLGFGPGRADGGWLRWLLPLAAATAALAAAEPEQTRSPVRVTEPKTEHISEALGVESQQPRFRWLLESGERGQLQTAY